MSDFLKGNYNLDKEIVAESDDKETAKDEFKKKALNSIGGSMVFVEREKYVWTGDEEDLPE
jgi:hypothetical protein